MLTEPATTTPSTAMVSKTVEMDPMSSTAVSEADIKVLISRESFCKYSLLLSLV